MAADHLSEKMKNVIWPEFRAHFRSAASAASYWSDLCEFAQITGADLTQAREQDVQAYYRIMTERVRRRGDPTGDARQEVPGTAFPG